MAGKGSIRRLYNNEHYLSLRKLIEGVPDSASIAKSFLGHTGMVNPRAADK